MDKLISYRDEINEVYGDDYHSDNAKKLIREKIKCDSDIYFISGGTITNMISISAFLKPYEAVIAVKSGHINVHETGAVEGQGHKIIEVDGYDGKIRREDIINVIKKHVDHHMVKPKLVFISNATEVGSVYTKAELKELKDICVKYDLYLYLDGARLAVSLSASDLSYEDYAKLTDAFYIGGTKIGAYFGEALVINNKSLAFEFNYSLKHYGGLLAKGFMAGIAFEALMENNLYYEIGKEQNEKAKYLSDKLKNIGISFNSNSKTNQIFPILNKKIVDELLKEFSFEIWDNISDDKIVVRFVTTFKTNYKDMDLLIEKIKSLR